MPYAPSVTLERMDQVFESVVESPYMALSFSVKDDISDDIPAAIHVDQTCRPNSVDQTQNSKYYDLIVAFERLTGIPLILNTSFNRHGIATIVTPRQAFEHLMNGCFDVLAIEDYIVSAEKDSMAAPSILYDEKYFILVEEIMPIIIAIFEDPVRATTTIELNQIKLERYGISFDPEARSIIINGDARKLIQGTRKQLHRLLFPFFENHEDEIWKPVMEK